MNESRATGASDALEQQSMASPLRLLLRRTPIACAPHTPIRDALEMMGRERVGCIVVVENGVPLGIFTQQDLLDRVVLPATDVEAPISTVMTHRPITVSADATAYEAALAMAQHHVRHLPVMEERKLAGVVSERDLFSVQRTTLRQLPETIAAAKDVDALVQAASDVRQLAFDMLAHGVAAEQLTGFIAALNDRLTQRVIALEQQRLALPQLRLCWIALGSEGRLEQTFATDQDNGILFAHTDNVSADAMREQLLPFAQAVNQALDRCGFPLCRGNIMAGNPRWCLSLAEWRAQFSAWIRVPEPQAVLNSAVFFDFRPVFGEAELAHELRAWLTESVKAPSLFLHHLVQGALQTRPPLGVVRDFVFDGSKDFPHTIDLKFYGLRPFIEVARILALGHGIAHTNTAQRLRLVAPRVNMSSDEMRGAIEAFYFIQLLRLRHQQSPTAVRAPNRIDPDALNGFDRRMLKESFRQARKLQQYIALEYSL